MADPLLEQLVQRPFTHPGQADARNVPCGGCRLCCRGNSIVMLLEHEGDLLEAYEHEFVTLPGAGHGPVLKRTATGDCVYLGPDGCTIHHRAPKVCRVFDCRGAYRAFMQHPRHERRQMLSGGYVDPQIMARGRELVEAKR